MFSHSDIWVAIDRLAKSAGYSTSGLARKAGLDPTAFNRSKRMSPEGKPRWPSTESLAKILSVTNVTMNDFITLIEVETYTQHHPASEGTIKKSVPFINLTQAAQSGYFDHAGYPVGTGWDYVELQGITPADDSVYAIEITGNDLEPLYREGDMIVVTPTSDIRRGDRIIIRTTDGQILVRELLRQTTSKLELRSLNPTHDDGILTPTDIQWMARILWVSQ